MNLKIKYRESFRPFAPAVLEEDSAMYFDLDKPSPFMLLVAPVKDERRIPLKPKHEVIFGIDKLNVLRSDIPAVTHVDYSARIQTVHPSDNPRFYRLIGEFKDKTGRGVIINTSFMRTEMDVLIIENVILLKHAQPVFHESGDWRKEYELD